jgi:hypothetical protein
MLGNSRRRLFFAALLGLLGLPALSRADFDTGPLTATGSNPGTGHTESATVDFNFVSATKTLTVTLTNSSTNVYTGTTGSTALQPADILLGVFFTLAGGVTMGSADSANLTAGSAVVNASANAADGWGFVNGNGGQGTSQAIAASGFLNNLGMSNFDNSVPTSLDGFDYGLVGSGYTPGSGVDGIPGKPLIQTSMTFVFHTSADLGNNAANAIGALSFQYGTALSELNLPGPPIPGAGSVPAPPSVILLGVGAGLMGLGRWRRRRSTDVAA